MRAPQWFCLIACPVLALACARLDAQADRASIDESGFVAIGGIDQHVTIRGDDSTNRVLLLLHGGPGDAQSPFRTEYAAYEREFTLVQWDQRGSGRTYGKYGEDTPDLTLDRLVADGIELSEYLRERLRASKIVLLGHSWGTVIGVEMALRRPDLFAAYVGTGQVGSWDRGVRYQFDFVRAKAAESGDTAVLDALANVGDFDPRDVNDFLAVNGPLRARLGTADQAWLQTLRERIQAIATPSEIEALVGGMNLSGRTLFPTQTRENLFATATRFEIPFIVIQGREDLFTPTPVALDYFEAAEAPHKELRVIEGAGHFALVTHRVEFLAALLDSLAAVR